MKIQRIQSDTDPAFAELVKIYTESLPENERKNAGLLSSMIQRSEYLFLVACRDNSVVGFSIALCFHDSDAALLEYIAVARDCRGREIGKFLFKETAGMKEVSERHLLVEVDSDREQSADRTNRTRRKSFYKRLGCKEIEGLSYVMPKLSETLPPAMDLLAYKHELSQSINKSDLRRWLTSCYIETYNMNSDDSRIPAMLDNLPDSICLI